MWEENPRELFPGTENPHSFGFLDFTLASKYKYTNRYIKKQSSKIAKKYQASEWRGGTGSNFIELLSTKICLAWNVCLDKNRISQPNFYVIFKISIQQLNTRKCNKMEIQLVILFLSRKKFHAKQIIVLSSSMKLGPGLHWRPWLWLTATLRTSFTSMHNDGAIQT